MQHVDLTRAEISYDPDDPPGFRAGHVRPGPSLGAKRTGATLYVLPPGEAVCPYHYELAEEEWLLVLAGRATVRGPEGSEELGPLALVFFPTTPEGAHQVRNDSEEEVRVLMWSETPETSATIYPDSDKVGVYAPGMRHLFRRESEVDYYDGETSDQR